MQCTAEELEKYRESARRRWAIEERHLDERYTKAWQLAKAAASLLRNEFGAKDVFVFGSLVHRELFHPGSDIDLAASGIDPSCYYRAVGRLLALDSTMEFDLVQFEEISKSWCERIAQEGVRI
ncbi:MAG: nucleotidyltransferase domain-containing protein [Desulfoferrobacter sp.]